MEHVTTSPVCINFDVDAPDAWQYIEAEEADTCYVCMAALFESYALDFESRGHGDWAATYRKKAEEFRTKGAA